MLLRNKKRTQALTQANTSQISNARKPMTKKAHTIRDLILPRDVQEVLEDHPSTCKFSIPDPNDLSNLKLVITPSQESMWHGGEFEFEIQVPADYNCSPPKVRCKTRIYHPNINETGEICLSILRHGIDADGWLPTRTLKSVICGLDSLFTDLVNFEDPLNSEAADHYLRDQTGFVRKVKDYIYKYCNNNYYDY